MWCSLTTDTITTKKFSSINGLQLTKTASSKWQKLHQSKQVNREPAGSEWDNWEQGGWSAAVSRRYEGMPRRRHTMRHSLRRTRTEWEARRVHDTRVSAARLECVGRYSRTERATDHRKPWEHSPRPHHQEPYQSVPQSYSHCRRRFIKVGKGLSCDISKLSEYTPPIPQPNQAGRRLCNPRGMQGWDDLDKSSVTMSWFNEWVICGFI